MTVVCREVLGHSGYYSAYVQGHDTGARAAPAAPQRFGIVEGGRSSGFEGVSKKRASCTLRSITTVLESNSDTSSGVSTTLVTAGDKLFRHDVRYPRVPAGGQAKPFSPRKDGTVPVDPIVERSQRHFERAYLPGVGFAEN